MTVLPPMIRDFAFLIASLLHFIVAWMGAYKRPKNLEKYTQHIGDYKQQYEQLQDFVLENVATRSAIGKRGRPCRPGIPPTARNRCFFS